MPPKGRTSNVGSEDLVEALLDPRILEQLGDALGDRIGSIVEAKLEIKLQALLGDFQKLKMKTLKMRENALVSRSKSNVSVMKTLRCAHDLMKLKPIEVREFNHLRT